MLAMLHCTGGYLYFIDECVLTLLDARRRSILPELYLLAEDQLSSCHQGILNSAYLDVIGASGS